jgi:hypothetical protein
MRNLITLVLLLAFSFAAPIQAAPTAFQIVKTELPGPGKKKTVKVKSYTKKNGTHVAAHTRSAPTKKKK